MAKIMQIPNNSLYKLAGKSKELLHGQKKRPEKHVKRKPLKINTYFKQWFA